MATDRIDEFEMGSEAGTAACRAALVSDIKAIIDHFNSELRALRREICAATGQPIPPC